MYAKIENNSVVEYPLDEWAIRSKFSNISFPSNISDFLPEGYVRVFPNGPPQINDLQIVTESSPVLIDGTWCQSWTVSDKFPNPDDLEVYLQQKLITKKESIWEAIKYIRDTILQDGVKVSVDGVNKWFHTDVYSRTQWLGLIILGPNIPANIQWKTMDGSFIILTQTIVQQIFSAIQVKELTAFQKAEVLRAEVNAATDLSTVESIDFLTGWPESFHRIETPSV